MAVPNELSLESVRDFMITNGGKVTNHDLVTYFKYFLTNPENRGKSIIIVNTWSTNHITRCSNILLSCCSGRQTSVQRDCEHRCNGYSRRRCNITTILITFLRYSLINDEFYFCLLSFLGRKIFNVKTSLSSCRLCRVVVRTVNEHSFITYVFNVISRIVFHTPFIVSGFSHRPPQISTKIANGITINQVRSTTNQIKHHVFMYVFNLILQTTSTLSTATFANRITYRMLTDQGSCTSCASQTQEFGENSVERVKR